MNLSKSKPHKVEKDGYLYGLTKIRLLEKFSGTAGLKVGEPAVEPAETGQTGTQTGTAFCCTGGWTSRRIDAGRSTGSRPKRTSVAPAAGLVTRPTPAVNRSQTETGLCCTDHQKRTPNLDFPKRLFLRLDMVEMYMEY